MATVVFIRHAQHQKESNNPVLDRAGRIQADKAGRTLLSLYPDRREIKGRTGPSRRARETADIIRGVARVPFSPDYRLDEITRRPTDISTADYHTALNRSLADPEYVLPGGVSGRQAAEAMHSAILSHISPDSQYPLWVVSHSGKLAAHWRDPRFVTHVPEEIQELDLESLGRVIPPGSITRFTMQADGRLTLVEDPETVSRLEETHRSARKE